MKLTPRAVFDALASRANRLRSTTWLENEVKLQESVTRPNQRLIDELKAELARRKK